MALKNSTDRSALERLLLSRLPRKEISTLVQSYTQPYRELMSYYRCAMMEVETKFNVLNEELSLQYDRNPIESIKTRLKSPESIAEKLQRRGFPLTVESIRVEATGEQVGAANIPGQLVRIPCGMLLERGDMLRGPVRNRA